MRFAYAESMCDPSFYLPLAKAAEDAGFTTFTVPDSICYPAESDSSYPYTQTGDRRFLEDKPFIEPFTLVPAMGAVTSKLRFATFVLKLPVRSPVLVAKSVASVAAMTHNRFSLGIGVSPWPEDFTVTFEDFKTRGPRTNEMIDIVRGLLETEGFFEFHGQHYDLPKIKICPRPTEKVPILVGGHSEPALARAVTRGDGWMFAGGPAEELARCLGRLRELRKEHGVENRPFQIFATSADAFTPDGIKRLEDLGVTDIIVGFRNPYTTEHDTQPLAVKIAAIEKYAERVLSKV